MSKESQVAIFRRDRWLCHWCRKPVIFAPGMKYLESQLKSAYNGNLAYYHKNWSRYHAPLLDELGAVIDHVVAHSRQGPQSDVNLVTACNKCNGRKGDGQLEKWSQRRVEKPIKGKFGEPQHWDGLSRLFVMLAERAGSGLTAAEKDWLRALRAN